MPTTTTRPDPVAQRGLVDEAPLDVVCRLRAAEEADRCGHPVEARKLRRAAARFAWVDHEVRRLHQEAP